MASTFDVWGGSIIKESVCVCVVCEKEREQDLDEWSLEIQSMWKKSYFSQPPRKDNRKMFLRLNVEVICRNTFLGML